MITRHPSHLWIDFLFHEEKTKRTAKRNSRYKFTHYSHVSCKNRCCFVRGEFFIESKQITHIYYVCMNEGILHFALYFYRKIVPSSRAMYANACTRFSCAVTHNVCVRDVKFVHGKIDSERGRDRESEKSLCI